MLVLFVKLTPLCLKGGGAGKIFHQIHHHQTAHIAFACHRELVVFHQKRRSHTGGGTGHLFDVMLTEEAEAVQIELFIQRTHGKTQLDRFDHIVFIHIAALEAFEQCFGNFFGLAFADLFP